MIDSDRDLPYVRAKSRGNSMRCPECGSEMEEDTKYCKNCKSDEVEADMNEVAVPDDVGVVFKMNDWLKTKEKERTEQMESETDEISRKLNERKRQMEEHQMKMNLDELIETIRGEDKSDHRRRKTREEAELADNLSRLSEDDFNKLVRELARDKKKEARSKLKDN